MSYENKENKKEHIVGKIFSRMLLVLIIIVAAILAKEIYTGYEGDTLKAKVENAVDTISNVALSDSKDEYEEVETESISGGLYAYECLSDEEKKVYDQILYCTMNFKQNIIVSTTDEDEVSKIFDFVLKDYPEIYWCDSYSITKYTQDDEVKKIEYSPMYTMKEEEKNETQQQIDTSVKKILSKVPKGATDYDKVKFVYDYLVTNITYNTAAVHNQNICSVFIYKESVCQGFTRAAQYLLKQLNVESVPVVGIAKDESHAWNLVKIGKKYYYMDTTWGNTEEFENKNEYTNYTYLCITTKELLREHKIKDDLKLPDCTSTDANYFVKEGQYFKTFDLNSTQALINRKISEGEKYISLKYTDYDTYSEAKTYLLDQKNIFDCDGIDGSISFYKDEEYYILTIFFD